MASIFNIQRYSVQDGPGVRTTVFMKGCSLRCLWCSNPESQKSHPQVSHRNNLCTKCGRCLEACPKGAISLYEGGVRINRGRCDNCGLCVPVCYPGALEILGREVTVEEVLAEVKKDALFYRNSGGGVTVSGGEPLAQPQFVAELLRKCRDAGLHTTLDTCGYAHKAVLRAVLEHVDLVLYDVKHMEEEAHRRATGVSNRRILANARAVASAGVPMIMRLPLIPGLNDDEENICRTARFAQELGVRRLDLLPYHRFGAGKYASLDRRYRLDGLASPPEEEMQRFQGLLESMGLECHVGG
ncbi:MAG: glycyl-radical enzyme activating protein [Dehalococcoidia bacterium]|nr:glycyl-radical enzyme activating protein [Dehalococcoidia bacterium]